MAETQDPAPGMDFWASLGIGQETPEQEPAPAGPPAPESAPEEWNAMFSDSFGPAAENGAPPAGEASAAPPTAMSSDSFGPPAQDTNGAPPKPKPARSKSTPKPAARKRQAEPSRVPKQSENGAAAARPAAERTGQNGGDPVMAGWQLIGALWADETVAEIHIRGTEVTVCRTLGTDRVPGFASTTAARLAVEAITAAQEEAGAVVRQTGGSVVVSRRHPASPGTAALVAAGVLTENQVSEVERALADTRAVTVTGPAAPVIVRALASLVPSGSRVFEAPFGVLPVGCVAAQSPLDADYVIGVRPGAPAEDMAAAGQIGALIANPETHFAAPLRLVVRGRSAAPGKVTTAG